MAIILAAQNLNSGIFPNGSSCGLVNTLAGLSLKQNGIKIIPSATSRSARKTAETKPRSVSTLTFFPVVKPWRLISQGFMAAIPLGSIVSNTSERLVMASLCQCCSNLPVVSTSGEYGREFSIGYFITSLQICRNQVAASIGRWETIYKNH